MSGGPAQPRKRRGLRILAGIGGVLLLAFLGLFVFVQVALKPEVYDVVSIKTLDGYQNEAMLQQAWALPVAQTYGPSELQYQPKVSYCGPTSLANVESSLGQSETPATILDGSGYCWSGQCIPGLTLDELAEIAREQTEREVTVIRDITLDQFREHMRQTNDPAVPTPTPSAPSPASSAAPSSRPGAVTTRRSAATSSKKTWCSCSTSTRILAPGSSRLSDSLRRWTPSTAAQTKSAVCCGSSSLSAA